MVPKRQKPPLRGGFLAGLQLAHDPVGPHPFLALRRLNLQAQLLCHVPANEPTE